MKLTIESSKEVKTRACMALIAASIGVGAPLYAQSLGVDNITIAYISTAMSAVAGIMSLVYIFCKGDV